MLHKYKGRFLQPCSGKTTLAFVDESRITGTDINSRNSHSTWARLAENSLSTKLGKVPQVCPPGANNAEAMAMAARSCFLQGSRPAHKSRLDGISTL